LQRIATPPRKLFINSLATSLSKNSKQAWVDVLLEEAFVDKAGFMIF